MGSGSLEPAFASGVPTIISEKAASTNDTAAFDRLSMTIPPLENATLTAALRLRTKVLGFSSTNS
jgi:hypothetical protein